MSALIRERERLEDLLSDRAMYGLSADEQREMERLLSIHSDVEPESFERAAASLALAQPARISAPMPAELRAKVEGGAKAFFAALSANVDADERRQTSPASGTPTPEVSAPRTNAPSPDASDEVRDVARTSRPESSRSLHATRSRLRAGWWLAAAAAIVAVIGWWPREATRVQVTREDVLASVDVLRADAQGTELAANAGGDVAWSNELQAGWLRVVDLPRNDPKLHQYQLWIFDAEQEHPIDGGVFDIGATGELLISIDAKLRVERPTLFAITLEKPGGVVVSDRQRIAWVAAL